MTRPTPIPASYWVQDRFLAGEYPGSADERRARERVRRFAAAGVTLFVDLTEEDEGLAPYAPLLDEGIRVVRVPVRDFACPEPEQIDQVIDLVDAELADGGLPYLHCWGGIGRTGTVVGCYLVEHGMDGEEALAAIAEWRAGTLAAARRSPETDEQRALILGWERRAS